MRCPKCDGFGDNYEGPNHICGPCPECQGSGIVSCCDTAGAHEIDWSIQMNGDLTPEQRAERRAALAELAALDADML